MTAPAVLAPARVQRTRTRGGGIPAGAVYVGRPTRWGNPFPVKAYGRYEAVEAFRSLLTPPTHPTGALLRLGRVNDVTYPALVEVRANLAGRDLACWCPPGEPCHADVLLEVANHRPPRELPPPVCGCRFAEGLLAAPCALHAVSVGALLLARACS